MAQRPTGVRVLGLIVVLVQLSVTGLHSRAQETLKVCPEGCPYSKVQAAVDAAVSGDTIEVLAGTYRESVVIGPKTLTLKGAGSEETIVASSTAPPSYPWGALTIWIKGCAHVTMEGFRIGGSKTGIVIQGPGCAVTMRNNTISASVSGIAVGYGVDLEVYGNLFLQHRMCGLNGKGNSEPVRGSGNRFIGSTLCGNVDPDLRVPLVPLTDESELRVPQDYGSIQEAVDAIQPGGTILVEPGYFTQENVSITKSLTLKRFPKELGPAILDGADRTAISAITQAEDVVVEGLAIRNGLFGLLLSSPQATIKGNHIYANSWAGIATGYPWTSSSGKVDIQENVIETSTNSGIVLSAQEAVIVKNRVVDNAATGIYLVQPTRKVEIWNNLILRNGTAEYARSANAGWGISAAVTGCDTHLLFDEPFTGEVIGGGNDIRLNGNGDVCPEELSYLTSEDGSEHP